MNRITVAITVPAAGRSFDVTIPTDLPLWQITELAGKTLSEMSGGMYQAGSDAALCDLERGEFLNVNMMAWELGLENGSRLMLI